MTKKNLSILLDGLILAAISAFFIHLYWQKWVDPTQDFGRELYVPWRMNAGEILYKNLAFAYGAFPPCWNALLFKIFGPSILTLSQFNTFISMLSAALIYRFFYHTCDRLTALTTTFIFLILFVFNNSFMSRNMYYLAPYSHSNFYAIFFALCSLNILQIFFTNPKSKILFLLGLFLGLMLLSRLEIFITFIIPVIFGLILFFWQQRWKPKQAFFYFGLMWLGLTLPVILFMGYFSQYFAWPEAFLKIIGYNPHWLAVNHIYMYQFFSGYINLSGNLKLIGFAILGYGFSYLMMHLLCRGIMLRREKRNHIQAFFIFVIVLIFFISTANFLWKWLFDVFRGQIIFLILLMMYSLKNFLYSKDKDEALKNLVLSMFCSWAILMLFKVPLRPILYNYGLIYCMPGVILSCAYLSFVIPASMEKKYRAGWAAISFVGAFLLVICSLLIYSSITWSSFKNKPIGQGSNQFFFYGKPLFNASGNDVQKFLQWADTHLPANATFVTFPEGIMLNFLTKHTISGSHISFMPAEMITFGENEMLKSLVEHPPDYILFVNKETLLYNNIIFGKNYANKIYSWVIKNYTPCWMTGSELGNKEFGIKVLKRNQQ